ncbi:hypothetical protein KIN20_026550 [Parelaphostrongylus tenuis]|uniref:Uncharacterized protein n=1 Tax=Parelaphostrongylus tenuis TaxID=148309 RepID=A0AAD5WCX1_PARTN|nr:hypothetical protein KIN20_026550 [Parelaphostrongylus tenuis]
MYPVSAAIPTGEFGTTSPTPAGQVCLHSDRDVLLDKSPRRSQCEIFPRLESCDMPIEEAAPEGCSQLIDPQYMP